MEKVPKKSLAEAETKAKAEAEDKPLIVKDETGGAAATKTRAEAEEKARIEAEKAEAKKNDEAKTLTAGEQAELERLETKCLNPPYPTELEMKRLAGLRLMPHKETQQIQCPHCKKRFVCSKRVLACPLCDKSLVGLNNGKPNKSTGL